MNWQDISTAPKDGTAILGYISRSRFDVPRRDVALVFWPTNWQNPTWVNIVDAGFEEVTHWMPLPEPPKE
jgi:hypothetical protein